MKIFFLTTMYIVPLCSMSPEYLEAKDSFPMFERSDTLDAESSLGAAKLTPEQKRACRKIKTLCRKFTNQEKSIGDTQVSLKKHARIVKKDIVKKRVKFFREIEHQRSELKKWIVIKSLLWAVAAGNTSYGVYQFVTGGTGCQEVGFGTVVNFGLSVAGVVGPWLPLRLLRPFSLYGDMRALYGLNRLESTVDAIEQQDKV